MKTLLIVLLLVFCLTLAGCNTVHGLASDAEFMSAYVRRATQDSVDRQREGRYQSAIEDRKQRLDLAASMIINDREDEVHTVRQY